MLTSKFSQNFVVVLTRTFIHDIEETISSDFGSNFKSRILPNFVNSSKAYFSWSFVSNFRIHSHVILNNFKAVILLEVIIQNFHTNLVVILRQNVETTYSDRNNLISHVFP